MFDLLDQLDLFGLIDSISTPVLLRVEIRELLLPKPQHIRLNLSDLRNF